MLYGLRSAGARDDQLAVLTYYKGQLRLYRMQPQAGNATFATVDGLNGEEYDYVILDLVTPGGRPYMLGFLTDVERISMGLSRAKIGLLIVGNQNMSDQEYKGTGTRAWGKVVEDHRSGSGLATRKVNEDGLADLMKEFGIPGETYEATPRRT